MNSNDYETLKKKNITIGACLGLRADGKEELATKGGGKVCDTHETGKEDEVKNIMKKVKRSRFQFGVNITVKAGGELEGTPD